MICVLWWLLLVVQVLYADALLCYKCDLPQINHTRCNENQPMLCNPNQGCGTYSIRNRLRKTCTLGCSRGDSSLSEKCNLCNADLCNSPDFSIGAGSAPYTTLNLQQANKTFKLFTHPTTYWEALNFCLRHRMTLANIDDVTVQQFLEMRLDATSRNNSTVNGFWIGAISADGDEWIWSDTGDAVQPPPQGGDVCDNNTNAAHQQWLPHHPRKSEKGRYYCAAFMWATSGGWMSVSCGEKVAAFLCQQNSSDEEEKSNYVHSTIYNGNVYTYYSKRSDANTAHQACVNFKSQLAMMHEQNKMSAVTQKLAFVIQDDAYWREQTCVPATRRASRTGRGTITSDLCSTKLPFLCQKPFKPATPVICHTTIKPSSQIVVSTTATSVATTAVSTTTSQADTTVAHTTAEPKVKKLVCTELTLFGEAEMTFAETAGNKWAYSKEKCPNGESLASAFCNADFWEFDTSTVTMRTCDRTIHSVKQELTSTAKNKSPIDLVKYSTETKLLTSRDNLTAHDVQDSIDVLKLLDKKINTPSVSYSYYETVAPMETTKVTKSVLSDIVHSVDNICYHLDDGVVSNQEKVELHRIVEDFASKVTINATVSVHKINTGNIDVQVVDFTSNNKSQPHTFVPTTNNQTHISVDQNLQTQAKRAYFVSYTNSTLFPSQQNVKEVITATVLDHNDQEVSVPVTFSFQRNNRTNSCTIETCSYYVASNQTWSTYGCHHLHDPNNDDDVITCVCNHTTSFAVVVSLRDDHVDVALDIASEVGLAICVFFLISTILLFIKLPELRRVRSANIHVNLCLCLTLTYLAFLLGIDQTSPRELCVFVAALIHYFLVAAWGWMAVESITMYRMFVTSMDRLRVSEFWKMAVSVYSVAVLVVGATFIGSWQSSNYEGEYNEECVYQDMWSNYVGDRYCWLTGPALYSFVAIIGVLLIVNMVLAFLVIKAITWGRRKVQSSTEETPAIHVLRAVLVAVLMGLSWVFAIPIVLSQDHVVQIVFGWFFAISTSMQGLFVFYFFCLRRDDVRSAWFDPLLRVLCGSRRKQQPDALKGAHSDVRRADSNVAMRSPRSWRRFTSSTRATNTTSA